MSQVVRTIIDAHDRPKSECKDLVESQKTVEECDFGWLVGRLLKPELGISDYPILVVAFNGKFEIEASSMALEHVKNVGSRSYVLFVLYGARPTERDAHYPIQRDKAPFGGTSDYSATSRYHTYQNARFQSSSSTVGALLYTFLR